MVFQFARNMGRLRASVESLHTPAGLPFRVHRWGRGERACVLVHGFGLQGRTWVPFTLPYADQFTFYAIDLPGHGLSFAGAPADGRGVVDQFADCLEALVARLGDAPYVLAGYSLGAFGCLRMLTRPRVRPPLRYLHLDHSPAPTPQPGWDGGLDVELFSAFRELERAVARSGLDLTGASFADVPVAIDRRYRRTIELLTDRSLTGPARRLVSRFVHALPILGRRICHRVAWPWALAVVRAYCENAFDLRADLAAIQVPTLVVSGSANRVFPAAAGAFLARALPHARHVTLPVNHDLPFAAPVAFTRLLGRFLKEGLKNDVHPTP